MNKRWMTPLFVVTLLLLSGCTIGPQDQYYWGKYEDLIHDMYVTAGKATPTDQIEAITRDIEKAEEADQTVPPGVYAHLGFMYSLEGDMVSAMEAFDAEKSLYKDSHTLIDGMLKRAGNLSDKK